jgi:hypothetical protein
LKAVLIYFFKETAPERSASEKAINTHPLKKQVNRQE